MVYQLTWLATTLKRAGLEVVEVQGWQSRGHGDVLATKGVICHHTAGPKFGDKPSLDVVVKGRSNLKGPLSQLFLSRDGTYYVVAAGLAWHAGAGMWQGIRSGNSSFIGIEAENTGLANDMPWPAMQYDAYVQGVAAILEHISQPAIMACGHKEYASPKGRKSDPTFDMDKFRREVAVLLGHTTSTDQVYVVKDGDGLYAIARAHKMRVADLLAMNNLTLATVIHPGQKLKVLSPA